MNKNAKKYLRAIQERAKQNNTYYVILKDFWTHGNLNDPRRITAELGCTDEEWKDVYRLEQRYQRFCKYWKEIEPDWQDVETIHYADNSIEIKQQNKYGETRRIMVKAPSGDICY